MKHLRLASLVLSTLAAACGGKSKPAPAPAPQTCEPAACGPALGMPNRQCSDGSVAGPTGRCLRQPDGACGWEVTQCLDTRPCVRGGCSGQLCVDEGDGGVSTCEYRPEYACYRDAICARQPSGACGWTPSPALAACLASPPAE